MARLLVIIPTTAGPLIIRKLGPRPALPASCAFADGDFRPLPWSADYARLTAKDGPLARLLPFVGMQSHELRLSGSFDAGRSWELPVALAHEALARGDTLTDDPANADEILFATGAIDLDLKVIPGDYALEPKLAKSTAIFEAAPQARLDIRLPHGPAAETALHLAKTMAGTRGNARIVGEVAAKSVAAPAAISAKDQTRAPVIAAGVIAAAAAFVGFWFMRQPAPAPAPVPQPAPSREVALAPVQPMPPAEVASPLIVEELRAPSGSNCRQVVFGAASPTATAVMRDKTTLAPSRLDSTLCGLRFKTVQDSRAQFTLPAELLATGLAPIRAADGSQTLFLKQNLAQNIVYRIQMTGEGLPPGLALTHEIRIAP
jgi:hypothetical protein